MRRSLVVAAATVACASSVLAAPAGAATDKDAVVSSIGDLAGQMHRQAKAGNVVTSAFSVSSALAALYAGAAGPTQSQIGKALQTKLPADRFAAGLGQLSAAVQTTGTGGDGPKLTTANSLWVDNTQQLRPVFASAVNAYGASLHGADFQGDPDGARMAINTWTSERTGGRIPELFAPGAITSAARLVIANAVYFKAQWWTRFDASQTRLANFHLSARRSARVMTMHALSQRGYASSRDWRAVRLDYRNSDSGPSQSMLLIQPRRGLARIEKRLSAAFLRSVDRRLDGHNRWVKLALPRFELSLSTTLDSSLQRLGLRRAYTDAADFSPMIEGFGPGALSLSTVVHKTFLHVDEEGTEAAAATGAVVSVTSAPVIRDVVNLRFDRPFLAVIQDDATGVPLFIARVSDPRG